MVSRFTNDNARKSAGDAITERERFKCSPRTTILDRRLAGPCIPDAPRDRIADCIWLCAVKALSVVIWNTGLPI